MRMSCFNYLLGGAFVAWMLGCGFLLFGYIDELGEPNFYQPAVCTITNYKIYQSNTSNDFIYNLQLAYGTHSGWIFMETVHNKASVEERFNTKIVVNAPFPCLATIVDNVQTPVDLYIKMPPNSTPLLIGGIIFIISFILVMLYVAAHFFTAYRRRHYQRLEGNDNEPVALVDNSQALDKDPIVTGSFAEAQKIFWENERLYSQEDFLVLRKLQVEAIVGAQSRKVFQFTLASHLRKILARQ